MIHCGAVRMCAGSGRAVVSALDQRWTSRPEPSWIGRTGHVQQHLLEAVGDRRDMDVYVCGLKAMVDDVRAQLKGMGFDRKQIIYEKYD